MASSAALVSVRIDAAQRVVGAEFDDHGVGPVRNRPVQPGEPAGGGVARHAGIGDVDGEALGFERLRQLGRKGILRRQAITGGERIAEHHDLHRPRRPRHRQLPAAQTQRQSAANAAQGAGPGPICSHMSGVANNEVRMTNNSQARAGHRACRCQSLARAGRGPRSYPQRHRPAYRQRRGDWPGRPVRLGQIDAADGDGRAWSGPTPARSRSPAKT